MVSQIPLFKGVTIMKEFLIIATAIALTATITQEPHLFLAALVFVVLGVGAAIFG